MEKTVIADTTIDYKFLGIFFCLESGFFKDLHNIWIKFGVVLSRTQKCADLHAVITGSLAFLTYCSFFLLPFLYPWSSTNSIVQSALHQLLLADKKSWLTKTNNLWTLCYRHPADISEFCWLLIVLMHKSSAVHWH